MRGRYLAIRVRLNGTNAELRPLPGLDHQGNSTKGAPSRTWHGRRGGRGSWPKAQDTQEWHPSAPDFQALLSLSYTKVKVTMLTGLLQAMSHGQRCWGISLESHNHHSREIVLIPRRQRSKLRLAKGKGAVPHLTAGGTPASSLAWGIRRSAMHRSNIVHLS